MTKGCAGWLVAMCVLAGCEEKAKKDDASVPAKPATAAATASAATTTAAAPAGTTTAASQPLAADYPSGAPSASAAPSAAPAACGAPTNIPDIPSERSKPPTLAEWEAACDINTQGSGSQAQNCTMKILREWLKVTCRGEVTGSQNMENFGSEGLDYFKLFQEGALGSYVLRLKANVSQKVRICRSKDGHASLFVSWPPNAPKPTIIALGVAPACEPE